MRRRFQSVKRQTEEGAESVVKGVTVDVGVVEVDDVLMFTIECPCCGLVIRTPLDKFKAELKGAENRVRRQINAE